MQSSLYDVVIIGGGIVGLSVGMTLARRYPDARILLLEKENRLAAHQTGRNSGVIHAGIYYKPGSLKARFAREGSQSMVRFCQEHGVPYDICGKVIVATEPDELPRLEKLYERGIANGLPVTRIGPEELKEREPHARGLAGIYSPTTGIVDYGKVAQVYARLFAEYGGEIRLSAPVHRIVSGEREITVETASGSFGARYLINCAGLHSDRLAAMERREGAPARIVPFRGEYYDVVPEKRHLVKGLIYPVPDPSFPFLGVHLTRTIHGGIHAGPNAVLAFKREGYHKTDFNARDLFDAVTYPGFVRLASKHWRAGWDEIYRSWSRAAFVKSMQRLVPEINAADVTPAPAGVRAQAVLPDGGLVDDFLLVSGPRALHVCNAPSPAATASLEIGKYVAAHLAESAAVFEKV